MQQRILTITDCLYPTRSGVLVQAELLCESLLDRGHSVVMVGPAAPGRDADEYDASRPYTTHRLPSIRNPFNRREFIPFRAGRFLRRLVAEFGPTVFLAHDPGLGPQMAVRIARSIGVPLVKVHHVHLDLPLSYAPGWFPAFWLARRLVIWSFRRACQGATRVIAVSDPIREMLLELCITTPISVIENAIDCRVFSEQRSNDSPDGQKWDLPQGRILCYAGRLSADKPVGLLIRAFEQLNEPEVVLAIAGDGPDLEVLHEQAAASSCASRIQFLGWVDRVKDLPELYRRAHAVVAPSSAEASPLTPLEALACGTPVILARGGGSLSLRNFVPDALWFDPGNLTSLVKALRLVLHDEAIYQEAVSRGRQLARERSVNAMVDQYLAIISAVTGAQTEKRA